MGMIHESILMVRIQQTTVRARIQEPIVMESIQESIIMGSIQSRIAMDRIQSPIVIARIQSPIVIARTNLPIIRDWCAVSSDSASGLRIREVLGGIRSLALRWSHERELEEAELAGSRGHRPPSLLSMVSQWGKRGSRGRGAWSGGSTEPCISVTRDLFRLPVI
jgi:hypothetical protein